MKPTQRLEVLQLCTRNEAYLPRQVHERLLSDVITGIFWLEPWPTLPVIYPKRDSVAKTDTDGKRLLHTWTNIVKLDAHST